MFHIETLLQQQYCLLGFCWALETRSRPVVAMLVSAYFAASLAVLSMVDCLLQFIDLCVNSSEC